MTSALSERLERWVQQLRRRTLDATHWSLLLEQGPAMAVLVEEFVAEAPLTAAT